MSKPTKTPRSKVQRSNMLALGVLALGSTAMLGELIKNPTLKGMALATGAAPYTKVFCAAKTRDGSQSFETFAADFILHYQTPEGGRQQVTITPEIYQKLSGPYQRRNVYGAVLAYGPAMPEKMQLATLSYALQEPGKIPQELGLPENADGIRVEMISRTQGSSNRWMFQCKR